MSRVFTLIPFLFLTLHLLSQSPIDNALKRYNSGDIPYINTQTAAKWQQSDSVIFLDTRSYVEFEVSHLPKAQFIGYKEFNQEKIKSMTRMSDESFTLQKSTPIVVYCSIGVRSEQIGLKLKKLGFNNIYNLYGGIVLWYNENREIVDSQERSTREIHGYDKNWAQYIQGGKPRF